MRIPVNRLRVGTIETLRNTKSSTKRERGGPSLALVYHRLLGRWGHAGWWPGESPLEVCLGAILTQNTAWANAEKALKELRDRRLLSFQALDRLSAARLAPLIRSSGTYRLKAQRVRAFVDFLSERYGGRVEAMAREPLSSLRRQLLGVPGIGPETADSILLYAVGKPTFVVDAYTRRIFGRLGVLEGHESYDHVQGLFHSELPRQAPLYNDYHAQIVRLGKDSCRSVPRCGECPLEGLCPRVGVVGGTAESLVVK
jgi:endonuclease-3 related protein